MSFDLDRRTDTCENSPSRFRTSYLTSLEEEYFDINLVKSLLDQIPGITYNTLHPFTLLQKNYNFLKMNCRDNIPDYFENTNKLKDIEKIVLGTFILCLIYGIELIILETWIGFVYPKYLWGIIIARKGLNCFWKVVIVLKFLLVLACIISSLILTIKYTG